MFCHYDDFDNQYSQIDMLNELGKVTRYSFNSLSQENAVAQ